MNMWMIYAAISVVFAVVILISVCAVKNAYQKGFTDGYFMMKRKARFYDTCNEIETSLKVWESAE